VLNRGIERPGLGGRFLILVGADEAAAEQRFQPVGMGARIRGVRPQPGDFRVRGCDRLLDAADLRLSQDKFTRARCSSASYGRGSTTNSRSFSSTGWLSTTLSCTSGPCTCGAIPITFALT